MTTYLGQKTQLFQDPDVVVPLPRTRSEGRLKTYPSTKDVRAWCHDIHCRRKHIIELVSSSNEKITLGRYVPIEVIIDTLLSNKDIVINELQQLLDEYKEKVEKRETVDFTHNAFEESDSKYLISIQKSRECLKWPCGKSGIPCLIRQTPKKIICKQELSQHVQTDESDDIKFSPYFSHVVPDDEEILKIQLKRKESECHFYKKTTKRAIEQLEVLQNIMEERNDLRRKLEESLSHLEILKDRMKDPHDKEIEELEKDIVRLRSASTFSPEDEIVILQKEIILLKKFSCRIRQVQEENSNLKCQLKRLRELTDTPLEAVESVDTNDPVELKSRLMELKTRFAKLEDIMDERDQLKLRVDQLECDLGKYEDLPEEVALFKNRAVMLNDVLEERDKLKKRLDVMECIEEEVILLKKQAEKSPRLELEVRSLNTQLRELQNRSIEEIEMIQSQLDIERERKKTYMANADDEIERLRIREKEAEVFKLERDKLKIQLYELAGGDVKKNNVSSQCGYIEDLLAERDYYKYKYEEVVGLECRYNSLCDEVDSYKDLDIEHQHLMHQLKENEGCIRSQEDEIRKLVNSIDRLSSNSKTQQDEFERVISTMRTELDEKKNIIFSSEEVLISVGDDLKSTITEVTSEANHLKTSVDGLSKELQDATNKIKLLEDQIVMLQKELSFMESLINEKDDVIRCLKEHLKEVEENDEILKTLHCEIMSFKNENSEKLRSGLNTDEHFEKVLKQSKFAVEKVAEYL